MAFLTEEDTTDAMCECFIEEFMRMGYSASQSWPSSAIRITSA